MTQLLGFIEMKEEFNEEKRIGVMMMERNKLLRANPSIRQSFSRRSEGVADPTDGWTDKRTDGNTFRGVLLHL